MRLETVSPQVFFFTDHLGQKDPWEKLREVSISKEEDSCDVVNKLRVQLRTNKLKDLLPPEQHICGCSSGSG